MSEQREHTKAEAQAVLQSSELTARLLRRMTIQPGIIDVRALRQLASRMTVSITRTLSLLDDLLTRYGIDDRSTIENPPLVMEQPWMVNINAYLTNYNSYSSTTTHNSFSSTTNQFISSDALPQSQSSKSLSSTSLLSSTLSTEPFSTKPSQSSTESAISFVRVPSHDVKSALDETASLPLPAGKFRVRRSPARRVWEKHSANAQDVARNTTLKSAEDSTAAPSTTSVSTTSASNALAAARSDEEKTEERKIESAIESAKARTLADTIPTKLPLARTQIAQSRIQRKSLEENANVLQPLAKTLEVKDTQQPAEGVPQAAPAAASVKLELAKPTREEIKAAESSHPAPGREGVPAWTSKAYIPTHKSKSDVQTSASTTALPLVQKQTVSKQTVSPVSPPIQKQPSDFIWRKGAGIPTMKDFVSAISDANPLQSLNQLIGGVSNVQQPQSSQTITPEAERRKDVTRAGSGISTERILRNISRKLLIERERRGY